MQHLKFLLPLYFLFASVFTLCAQAEKKSYSFKQGEVFDIIFLSQKPDTKDLVQKYFSTAFPVATALGYQPLKGFAISQSPTQGNYHPQSMILGSWSSLENRTKFVTDIDQKVPDFHEQRRAIWSNFDLTYYPLKEALSFEVDPAKFNVATIYWQKDAQDFQRFKKQWLKQSQKAGAQTILELSEGHSPFGYHFQPDYLVLTEWASKEAFEAFNRKNLDMDQSAIEHVNQFILD